MKKCAPKIKKKKVPGYILGGTTLAYQMGDPNKVDETIYKPEKLGKGSFKNQLGDFGRGAVETLAGVASIDIDPKYKTDNGRKYGQINDKFVAPILGEAGAVTANYFVPGAGAALKTVGSTVNGAMEAKRQARLPDETDSDYSKRMAAMGIDVSTMAEDDATRLAMTGISGAIGGFVGTTLENKAKKKEAEKVKQEEKLKNSNGYDVNQVGAHYNGGIVKSLGLQKKSDGGEVDGPAGKDKVKALIEPGSFVVPAKNAHIAKMLDEKIFGVNEGKANLNQGGGVPVMLTDTGKKGEYLFTPEKKHYLETVAGIDLNKLAPDAKEGTNHKVDGGPIASLNKLLAQRKADKESLKNAKLDKESKRNIDQLEMNLSSIEYDIDKLNKAIEYGNTTYSGVPIEDAAKHLLKIYSSNQAQYNSYVNAVKKAVTSGSKNSTNTTKIADPIVKPIETKNGQIVIPKGTTKKSNEPTTLRTTTSAAKTNSTTSTSKTNSSTEPEYDFMAEVNKENAKKLIPMVPKQGEDLNTNTTQTSGEYTDPNKRIAKNRNYDITSGLDLGIGIAQTAIAAKNLLGDGARPLDKLAPDYLGTLQTAKDNAAYGFSNAEMTGAQSDIESNRRAMVENAVSMGNGNFATSMANSRAAGSISAKSLIDLKAADNQLKLQKQAYRDNLIKGKVELDRRLFEDKLNAFNVNQQAGANMLQAGIKSIQTSAANRRAEALTQNIASDQNNTFANSLDELKKTLTNG